MDAWVWIAIAVAAAIVAVIVVATVMRRRRRRQTEALRSSFGEEYDRRVRESGDRRRTESRLVDVRDRHDRLELQPLNAATRARFLERWREVQARFLDQPGHALDAADVLVREVLQTRGYPPADYDDQVDLVALDHPEVVRHYRAAHETLDRTRAGMSGTEDVRVAMIQYRSVFEALIAAPGATPAAAADGRVPAGPARRGPAEL
jgi:hypothetical protein